MKDKIILACKGSDVESTLQKIDEVLKRSRGYGLQKKERKTKKGKNTAIANALVTLVAESSAEKLALDQVLIAFNPHPHRTEKRGDTFVRHYRL